MRNFQLSIIGVGILLSLSAITFAQSQPATQSGVPASISQNCLLTQSGTIDFCPTYRNQVREINDQFYKQRTQIEKREGLIKLLEKTSQKIASLQNPNTTLLKNTLKDYPRFAADYELYLTTLFEKYIKANTDKKSMVSSFFETTYFDQDQDGLGITAVKIYNGTPQQYDKSILLQVSVRNYTPNPISNIEDLYCFTTVNDKDYIHPFQINTSFKENTITNLVVQFKTEDSNILDQFGKKNIACTLIYSQVGQLKYTNRGKFSFSLQPNE